MRELQGFTLCWKRGRFYPVLILKRSLNTLFVHLYRILLSSRIHSFIHFVTVQLKHKAAELDLFAVKEILVTLRLTTNKP